MLHQIILALALTVPTLAQWDEAMGFQQQPKQYQQVNTCPGGAKAGMLRVTGANNQSAKADQASFDVTFGETQANSSSKAINGAMAIAAAVTSALTSEPNAVAQDDIKTESAGLSSYMYNSTYITYSYTTRLSVKVVNVTSEVLTDVLNSTIAAGGRSLEIRDVMFSLSEARRSELKRKARRAAVAQAKDKALQLSEELGVSLSHILSVEDDPSSTSLRNIYADPVGAGKQPGEPKPAGPKPPGITVGTQYIGNVVVITYSICNPTTRSTPMDAPSPAPL